MIDDLMEDDDEKTKMKACLKSMAILTLMKRSRKLLLEKEAIDILQTMRLF